MMKRAKILIILILFLTILLSVTIKINKNHIEKQKELLEKAQIILKYKGLETVLSMDDIMLYNENFEAVLDTSTTDPSTHIYRGVELKDLLKNNNIDYHGKVVLISAADGFSIVYSSSEIEIENNIYIAFMKDGKYLGNRESGGSGPYESIVVSDLFSNRRCKWITEIEVK